MLNKNCILFTPETLGPQLLRYLLIAYLNCTLYDLYITEISCLAAENHPVLIKWTEHRNKLHHKGTWHHLLTLYLRSVASVPIFSCSMCESMSLSSSLAL